MDYPVAFLTEEDEMKVKQLEQELGVVLIAYDKEDENPEQATNAYIDDPNVNII